MSLMSREIVQAASMVASVRDGAELFPETSRAAPLVAHCAPSRELVSEGCEQTPSRVRILNASRILYRTSSVDARMYTASCETVVTISGELDVVSVRLLEPLLLELIKADDLPMALRLDALTFIDSRGLQGIARLARAARCADSRLIVRSVDSRVVRLLEITGIDQLLCIDVQTRTAIER